MTITETVSAMEQQHLNAYNQQDWQTLASFYTENAVSILPNGQAITGKDNVVANFSENEQNENIRFDIIQCEESGDLCYAIIELKYDDPEGNEVQLEMLQVLKRNDQGQWLIQANSYSGSDQTVH